jgi:phytol kinase
MSPFFYNCIVTVISIIYVFSVVAIMDWFVKKGFPQDISRKIVHIAAGSWIFFWVFFNNSHWSKYLNIAPAFIWTVLLIQKGFFAKPEDEAVKTMTRTGDRRELLKGPLYFTIVMNLMGTFFYNSSLSVTAMAYLGWGDGIAPVIGKRFGKHKYKILSEKSIEGSLAFLIFGFLAAVFFNYLIFGKIGFIQILITGIVAMISEAMSPRDADNLIIPIVISILYIFIYGNFI